MPEMLPLDAPVVTGPVLGADLGLDAWVLRELPSPMLPSLQPMRPNPYAVEPDARHIDRIKAQLRGT